MTMLMDYTDEGRTRIEQIVTDGLVFSISHVAYGSSGYNFGNPNLPLPLVPAATSLVAEVYRKEVTAVMQDEIGPYRGKETVYTTVGGREFTSILGEAGLICTVQDPGTTGLLAGYTFLLAHAHFPRTILSLFGRLAVKWPLDLQGPAIVYTSALTTVGGGVSLLPTVYGPGFGAFALSSGSLPPSLSLNPATGEISGTLGPADLLGGSPAGEYSGIVIQGDATVDCAPFSIKVLGLTLPAPIFYSPMEIDSSLGLVFDGSGLLPATVNGAPTSVPGSAGNAVSFDVSNSDFLEIAHDASLDLGASDYTIVGTVKVTAAGLSEVLNKIDTSVGTNAGIGMRVLHNQAVLFHGDGSGAFLNPTIGFASIDDAAFHNVAWVATRASNGELFVDGVSQGTSVISTRAGSVSNAEPLVQGGTNSGGPAPNATSVDDEVALFDVALTDEEVATCAWLAARSRSLASWIRGNGPSVPIYPAVNNLLNGAAASIPPSTASFTLDGDPVTYIEYDPLPTGLSLNPSTGEITGVPTVDGVYTGIKIAVSDGMNLVLSSAITISVS